jgi:hypothetical protein
VAHLEVREPIEILSECHEAFLGRRLRLAQVIRVPFVQGMENLEHHPLNVVLGQWLTSSIESIPQAASFGVLPGFPIQHSVPPVSTQRWHIRKGLIGRRRNRHMTGLIRRLFPADAGGADTSRRAHPRARLIQLDCVRL